MVVTWGAVVLQGKVHVISLEGLHQLHIFIFVMTCVHVAYSCITIFLGFYKMLGWTKWEEETRADDYDQVAGTASIILICPLLPSTFFDLHCLFQSMRSLFDDCFFCVFVLPALRKGFKLKRTKTYVASTDQHPLSCASLLSWLVSLLFSWQCTILRISYIF